MRMPAHIVGFEVETHDFKRGITKIPVLRVLDMTPDYRLRDVLDLELTDEQARKFPGGDLSNHVCELGIRELFRGVGQRLRMKGDILSLDGKPF